MSTHKIALFGLPGETIQHLTTEALRRGHHVTTIVPDKKEFTLKHPNLIVMEGDMMKKEDVSKSSMGHDVVICAHEPSKANPHEHVDVTRAVIEGVKEAGIHHLVSAAHPYGLRTENTEKSYNEFRPIIAAQQNSLRLFQNEKDLHWGYAHSIAPEAEKRTNKYTFSNEVLITNAEGQTRIPLKSYASAVIDEAERGEMELLEHNEEEREY